jgi:hypothetical protein
MRTAPWQYIQRIVLGAAPIAFETATWTHRHSRFSPTMNCSFCSHWVDKSCGIGGILGIREI